MKKLIPIFLICLSSTLLTAQNINHYEINADVPDINIDSTTLRLGGKSMSGDKISVNNYFLSLNNKPFIPITGEFHYSRYPRQYWDEAIKKMKAGGINVIASYVFWNIHEEEEGKFRWDGDRDLRHFAKLCAGNNIFLIVRIGPFGHGEIRNGALPDWLLGRPVTIRSNDPGYLKYVERFYDSIGTQLSGLYFKENGPIIGIQIENEYQHSAAPWGLSYPGQPYDLTASEKDLAVTKEGVSISTEKNPYEALGNSHMKILKTLAIKAGMDVPIYTATGWGNGAIIPDESIPVTAAYAYPFWTKGKDLSPFFLYKDMHKVPDYSPVRYDPSKYPVFAAELGSGIMSIYARRPIAVQKSFDAMINRCLGSGANGIGYYMYHGGSTPKGNGYYFNDEVYGLPKISYDFQAPIGEFGQVREGFHRLKLLHWFVQDFGNILAPMETVLPKNAASIAPENIKDLRFSVRKKGSSGFLFLNNFQDDTTTLDKKNIAIKIKTETGDVTIPDKDGFNLKSEENAIFPFNLDISGVNLRYATAQLLAKNDAGKNKWYIFFRPDGVQAEFLFSKKAGLKINAGSGNVIKQSLQYTQVKCAENTSEFTVQYKGIKTTILIVDKALALESYVAKIKDIKHIIFSDALVMEKEDKFTLTSDGENNVNVLIYPKTAESVTVNVGKIQQQKSVHFSSFTVSTSEKNIIVDSRKIEQKKYVVRLPESLDGMNDLFLEINYIGDTGMGFLDGELVTDEFYKGIPWRIGLKKFYPAAAGKEMVFYFRPLYKNAGYLNDLDKESVPDFGKANQVLKINSFKYLPQYKTVLSFK